MDLSQQLARLVELKSDEGVLSAYVKVDPRLAYQPGHPEVELKSALKAAEARIKHPKWKETLRRERKRVLEFVSQWKPSARGLAIFSSAPAQTMEALLQEKVRTLLLPDGAEIQGTACVRCDYLGTEESGRCPLCGGELESGNITGRLVGKALATGARIESLHGPASEKLVGEGGIAALLRYA